MLRQKFQLKAISSVEFFQHSFNSMIFLALNQILVARILLRVTISAHHFRSIIMDGIENKLFGGVKRQLLYKALDASTKRGRAIAQNIANVETEGYKRKEVSFEEKVREALKIKLEGERTKEDHFEISKKAAVRKIQSDVYEPNDPTLPGEVTNVDIDIENAKMAENQIMYNYLVRFSGFDKYNAAIKGQSQ